MGNLFEGHGFRVAARISLLSNRVQLMFRSGATFYGAIHMRPLIYGTVGALLAICLVPTVDAQETFRQSSRPEQPAPNGAGSPATLTGKERLGRKWMDEQRIDNCNVPVDKRGSKARPGVCPHVPMG